MFMMMVVPISPEIIREMPIYPDDNSNQPIKLSVGEKGIVSELMKNAKPSNLIKGMKAPS